MDDLHEKPMASIKATEEHTLRISKYRDTRFWAVWIGDELLAVTVYKKGAMAVKNTLTRNPDGLG